MCSEHGKHESGEPHNDLYRTYAHVLLVVLNIPADKYIRADLSAAGLAIAVLSKAYSVDPS